MPTILLNQVKTGDKIIEDVQTSLGGILFYKGKVITPRELEILHAFLIQSVIIEAREGAQDEAVIDRSEDSGKESKVISSFQKEYGALVQLLKKIYSQFTTGQGFPILEIRTQLEALISNIKDYNILTFLPDVPNEEDYLLHNSVMCALTSYQMAQWNSFSQKDWMPAALAGLLHDIGNVRIDRAILYKPTKLTLSELEEMKQHTVYGYQMLKPVAAINEGVKLAAIQHHEKIDGSGYPFGIKGDKIHPYAKIVAIADIYHAMTLKRTYRQATSPYLVLEQLQKDSFGKLDPLMVQVFIEKTTRFHNGTIVRLNDGRIGEIVFSDRNHMTRPWVSVNGIIVNLTTERQTYIQEIINL